MIRLDRICVSTDLCKTLKNGEKEKDIMTWFKIALEAKTNLPQDPSIDTLIYPNLNNIFMISGTSYFECFQQYSAPEIPTHLLQVCFIWSLERLYVRLNKAL